jgi:glutathione peroxidase
LRMSMTLLVSVLLSAEPIRSLPKVAGRHGKADGGVSYTLVASPERTMSGFYDIAVTGIDGTADLLGRLRGKVALAVNVASRCGLTPQYQALEELQRELADENFTVVGFPCNQFGAQEPGSEAQIVEFCRSNYDVTFPLSAKLDVNGAQRHPLYTFLTAAAHGFPGDISWNFEKFLIGRDGRVLKRYPPQTQPRDRGLMQDLADAL